MDGSVVWFLTHPEVAVDPEVEVAQWGLSAVGRARATALRGAPFLARATSVWSSTERKAAETADLIAEASTRHTRADLGENDRTATGFLEPAEFERIADAFFAHPDESIRGWASARSEQARIIAAVDTVLASPDAGDGDVVIVSHGGVGTLLLCHLLGRQIDRSLDQPGQGHAYSFDRTTRAVRFTWRPLEALTGTR